ncbi:glycosyltransferase [Amnibacterium flavum]|uniref:4,4'-diaponeurosporenoate glycosyltransferase n=1 Tax=Amnibacterium flavum TaxID=2173173 RepID=A0A2V1HTL8_9MICO|nr:glycosyltransferase [Amnibacterium flavum]PVZ95908.1 glycosyl transferase [Amnibacterium flavum]
MTGPTLSIVMPAHDEAAVIARALEAITRDASPGEFEIVVVANGCTDDTVARARSVDYPITVLDIATPSKIAALNAGDEAATAFPRLYIDADIEIGSATVRELADLLREESAPLIAAPHLVVDASRSSWAVRAHYRIWDLSDYVRRGHVGSGVYALNRSGRERFGTFPEVIADDRYVQQLFAADERRNTAASTFTVRAPRTFSSLLKRSVRAAAGNRQLVDRGLAGDPAPARGGPKALLKRVMGKPALWPSFAVYAVGYVVPRVMARRKLSSASALVWDRDETSRV